MALFCIKTVFAIYGSHYKDCDFCDTKPVRRYLDTETASCIHAAVNHIISLGNGLAPVWWSDDLVWVQHIYGTSIWRVIRTPYLYPYSQKCTAHDRWPMILHPVSHAKTSSTQQGNPRTGVNAGTLCYFMVACKHVKTTIAQTNLHCQMESSYSQGHDSVPEDCERV